MKPLNDELKKELEDIINFFDTTTSLFTQALTLIRDSNTVTSKQLKESSASLLHLSVQYKKNS